MMPALKNMVISRVNRIGVWAKDPGRDRPYAQRMDTTMLRAVPVAVTPTLTSTALVTTPPLRICW
nr:hypothetical protein GCM10017547_19690 [Pseudarthrobacter oxydans]